MNNSTYEILFARLREDAKIPFKRNEDAGYDIYASFKEDHMKLEPHETKMIPSGLICAFSSDLVMQLWERGSTGTKGIGQRCGVIDSGYRDEIFVPITNHNTKPLLITKETNESVLATLKDDFIIYPYTKAICQGLMEFVPPTTTKEMLPEEIRAIPSERGCGKLGSSGK